MPITTPEQFKNWLNQSDQWEFSENQNGKNYIWRFVEDENIFLPLPKNPNTYDYDIFERKNAQILLQLRSLDFGENSAESLLNDIVQSYDKILIQLKGENNIAISSAISSDLVFETQSKVTQSIKRLIKNFNSQEKNSEIKMGQTRRGSYIIPLLIPVKTEGSIFITATANRKLISDYLNQVNFLTELKEDNKKDFAKKIFEKQIDSNIVTAILSENYGLVKTKTKYKKEIKDICLIGETNKAVDFLILEPPKEFPAVSFKKAISYSEDFIFELEKLEIKDDGKTFKYLNVSIICKVIGLMCEKTKSVKLELQFINGDKQQPYKIDIKDLSEQNYQMFYNALGRNITILGDIQKETPKSRVQVFITRLLQDSDDKNFLF